MCMSRASRRLYAMLGGEYFSLQRYWYNDIEVLHIQPRNSAIYLPKYLRPTVLARAFEQKVTVLNEIDDNALLSIRSR